MTTSSTREIFSIRLKELRKNKGISQRELARKVKVSSAMVSDYEAGKRSPTIEVLEKFARFFGVSTDYLLGLTDNPSPKHEELPEVIRKKLERFDKLEQFYQIIVEAVKNFEGSDSHRQR